MCRRHLNEWQFLLVHPGGPFFKKKDLGWWTIPKGLVSDNESALEAACREFQEETGMVPEPPYYTLGQVKLKSGKMVKAWGCRCPPKYLDWDPETDLISNSFNLEWPPRSGRMQSFSEVDRAGWFNRSQASQKLNHAQLQFLETASEIMPIKG